MMGLLDISVHLSTDVYHCDSGRSQPQILRGPRPLRGMARPSESIYIPDPTPGAQDHFMIGLLDISVHLSTDLYHCDLGQSHLKSL